MIWIKRLSFVEAVGFDLNFAVSVIFNEVKRMRDKMREEGGTKMSSSP